MCNSKDLYNLRYTIERTNAWMDSFRSLLNRFDTTVASWLGFNYLSFIVITIKKFKKRKKFKSVHLQKKNLQHYYKLILPLFVQMWDFY